MTLNTISTLVLFSTSAILWTGRPQLGLTITPCLNIEDIDSFIFGFSSLLCDLEVCLEFTTERGRFSGIYPVYPSTTTTKWSLSYFFLLFKSSHKGWLRWGWPHIHKHKRTRMHTYTHNLCLSLVISRVSTEKDPVIWSTRSGRGRLVGVVSGLKEERSTEGSYLLGEILRGPVYQCRTNNI